MRKADTYIAARLAAVRELMTKRGYDAILVRNVSDLRWLTGAARVFDSEQAHDALITQSDAWVHTDGRYFGALTARTDDRVWQLDQDDVTHATWAACRIAECGARVVAIEDSLSLGFYEELQWELQKASVACLMPRLHGDFSKLRMHKDEAELDLLRRAQKVTDAAFAHMCDVIHPGLSELQIRAELESFMLSHGADALAFDSIVASGPNGANPHARPSARAVERGDLLVMDFGASLMDYQSDMTRTICIGKPTERQQSAYDAVRHAHEECARVARPGMLGRELHELAARILEEEGYGSYFTHGLGHGVGIDIHELPVAGKRGELPLDEGAVFTIEPGVYLPGEFGIRLEDCGVMGPEGYLPFTESPHALISVCE